MLRRVVSVPVSHPIVVICAESVPPSITRFTVGWERGGSGGPV